MFSKAGKHAPHAVKPSGAKASKVSKSTKHGRAKRVPVSEHALSTAFSGQVSLLSFSF